MAIDEKTLNKIKKEISKGDEKLPDILKRLPDILDKSEGKGELSPEQRERLKKYGEKFLEKFKEKKKKKIEPKVKPDPDRKDKNFKDFFRKLNPENRKKFYDIMPYKMDPDRPRLMPDRLPFDPNKKMPRMEPTPYKMLPSDKMPGVQLLKKGGTVKGYKAGGEVKTDKSPNSGMITKRGWGKSRKT
jgi:hypothetical protein